MPVLERQSVLKRLDDINLNLVFPFSDSSRLKKKKKKKKSVFKFLTADGLVPVWLGHPPNLGLIE